MDNSLGAKERFDEITYGFYNDVETRAGKYAEEDGSDTIEENHVEDAYLVTIQSYREDLIAEGDFAILGKGRGDFKEELVSIMGQGSMGEIGKLVTYLYVKSKGKASVSWLISGLNVDDQVFTRRDYFNFIKLFSSTVLWYYLRDHADKCLTEKHRSILKKHMLGYSFAEIGKELGSRAQTVSEHYYRALRDLMNHVLF